MFSFLDRHVEKENLADFIAKKREMFLVQVSWNLTYILFAKLVNKFIVLLFKQNMYFICICLTLEGIKEGQIDSAPSIFLALNFVP